MQNDPRLPKRARDVIVDSERQLSLASCWELAIKVSLKRIGFDRPLSIFLTEQMLANGISLLPIGYRHVMRVCHFPFHHRDPFDRLLAAQALEERFSLISADPVFDHYGVSRIWTK
jgi:PIN domain nuclease of toxin-antitoxin system